MEKESSREPSPESEFSIESGSSSTCDLSEQEKRGSPEKFTVPANAEEFENLVQKKRQMLLQKTQLKPTAIFVDLIPENYGRSQLIKIFSQFGRVLNCHTDFIKKKNKKGHKTWTQVAYVLFSNADEALQAVQFTTENSIYRNLFHCVMLSPEQTPNWFLPSFNALKTKSISPLRFNVSPARSEGSPSNSKVAKKRRSTLTPGPVSPLKKFKN